YDYNNGTLLRRMRLRRDSLRIDSRTGSNASLSLVADHIGNLAHLNARNITLVFCSRAPQADIERVKARMDWQIPWYTLTDDFGDARPSEEWSAQIDRGNSGWAGTPIVLRAGRGDDRTWHGRERTVKRNRRKQTRAMTKHKSRTHNASGVRSSYST